MEAPLWCARAESVRRKNDQVLNLERTCRQAASFALDLSIWFKKWRAGTGLAM
jgi:hypothetical protein